jgi:hypothetical protein
MSDRLEAIACEGAGVYRVRLKPIDGTAATSFVFEVDEGDIPVVKWGSDFDAYMDRNAGRAAPLFEVVLAFHRARSLTWPPRS